jgi:hypothetical protein
MDRGDGLTIGLSDEIAHYTLIGEKKQYGSLILQIE